MIRYQFQRHALNRDMALNTGCKGGIMYYMKVTEKIQKIYHRFLQFLGVNPVPPSFIMYPL